MKSGLSIFVLFLFCQLSLAQETKVIGIDTIEAKVIFNYLQGIRLGTIDKSDPMFEYYDKNRKLPLLTWNDTLAGVARNRAMDMAKQNYFNHIDPQGKGVNYYINKAGYSLRPGWLDNPKNNYFESISAGNKNGIEVVKFLIIDKISPEKGHRIHLLGQNEWNFKNTDIGVGFYRISKDMNSDYSTYTVIIIAHHR